MVISYRSDYYNFSEAKGKFCVGLQNMFSIIIQIQYITSYVATQQITTSDYIRSYNKRSRLKTKQDKTYQYSYTYCI